MQECPLSIEHCPKITRAGADPGRVVKEQTCPVACVEADTGELDRPSEPAGHENAQASEPFRVVAPVEEEAAAVVKQCVRGGVGAWTVVLVESNSPRSSQRGTEVAEVLELEISDDAFRAGQIDLVAELSVVEMGKLRDLRAVRSHERRGGILVNDGSLSGLRTKEKSRAKDSANQATGQILRHVVCLLAEAGLRRRAKLIPEVSLSEQALATGS